MIASIVCYYTLGQNLVWIVVMLALAAVLFFFCFSSQIYAYAKKKRRLGIYIVIILAAVSFVFLAFSVHSMFQTEKVKKEIAAVDLMIEREEDEEEFWHLREERDSLSDKRFALSQRVSLFNIAALSTFLLINVFEIIYRGKETGEKQTVN